MEVLTKFDIRKLPVTSHETGDGAVFYDFGSHAFAVLELEACVDQDQVITVAVGEVAADGRIVREPGGSRIYQEATVKLHAGMNHWQMTMTHPGYNNGTLPIEPNVAPFRYAEIRSGHGQFQVIQHAYYGRFSDEASEFHSSSPNLDRIWEFCRHSIKATTPFGIFIDGNRERQAYEGDTYINQLSYFACTSDKEIPAATIRRLFEFPTWPTEWQLSMIPILHDYLLYTGDFDLVRKYYRPLQEKLLLNCMTPDHLLSVARSTATWACPGFGTSIRIRDIVDWPEAERDGYEMGQVNLVPNCWHYMALTRMAELAALLGCDADAEDCRARAAVSRRTIRQTMLKNGLFVDNPDSEHTALHSDIFPLLWGLADEAEKPAMLAHLQSRGMACSVFGAQFLLECCYANRLADYGLQLMTSTGLRSWNNMLDKGATISMEAWDDSFKPNQDWNHPWGAAPGNIIVRHLAGIRPTKPGFSEFAADPQPGALSEFFLRTPTPHGEIRLIYHRDCGYELTVPAGTRALCRGHVLPSGVHHVEK